MVKLTLYSIPSSPPVRAVWLVAKELGLDLEIKNVDLLAGEHLLPAYLKINPQHTVPTLDDNGQYIWDSHAIVTYLIDKYGKSDELYPKDLYTRARIDQRLFFDSGILFPRLRNYFYPIIREGCLPNEDHIKPVFEAYDLIESLFRDDLYLVGNTMTVADLSCITSVTQMEIIVPVDGSKYPKIRSWIERLAKLPYFEEFNFKEVAVFKEFVDQKIATNRAAAGL